MKELFRRLSSKPGLATELVAASLFANVLALATPLFVIQVLNRYIAHGVDATLATLASGVLIAIALEFAFRQVRLRLARGVSVTPDERSSMAGYAVLVQAKPAVLERIPPGARSEIVNGATAIETAYGATNIAAVLDVPFAFLFIFVLFLLNPIISGIVAAFVLAVFVIGTISAYALRKPTRALLETSGPGNALVSTAIGELDMVRAFNAGGFLLGAWEKHTRMAQGLRRFVVSRQGLLQTITQSSTAMMSVCVISVGASLVVSGDFDVGAMIGANILGSRALMPISRFAQLGEVFAKARQSLDLLREFTKVPLEASTGSAKRKYDGGLELRDLAFAYPGSSGPLFESLSLKLGPGMVLVVSGANGTGKTTLARLLVGLLEPNRGQILADGLELKQMLPKWWRRQLIYLPQEPAFLNASIAENLRLANPDMDDQALNRVIDAVGLRHFLDESPKGFETPIIGNGRHLSRGIRRRLALARALASDGTLAILDEPTEGLDGEGCAAVYAIMNELVKQGRTIIVFSHDPTIVKGAAAILDLNSKPVPRIGTLPRAVDGKEDTRKQEEARK